METHVIQLEKNGQTYMIVLYLYWFIDIALYQVKSWVVMITITKTTKFTQEC